jgi:hypothetical protein
LYARVRVVVHELKAAGWSPELVVGAVKQVADDSGLHIPTSVIAPAMPRTERDVAVVHLVRWCIEHYYGINIPHE